MIDSVTVSLLDILIAPIALLSNVSVFVSEPDGLTDAEGSRYQCYGSYSVPELVSLLGLCHPVPESYGSPTTLLGVLHNINTEYGMGYRITSFQM